VRALWDAAPVLALTRLRVPAADAAEVEAAARAALADLAARPGFVRGHLGRAADDPELWVLATEWDAVGSYRRGLSAYDVKVSFAPLMTFVVAEPGAYEVVAEWAPGGGGGQPSEPV
jgi:quinol monooxygenase YgiN